VTDAIVGFHAQQAAEKALKPPLAAAGRDFPFTHNIAVLMQLCEDAGIGLPHALDDVDVLTPFGVAARYGTRSPGAVDRATALDLAGSVVASCSTAPRTVRRGSTGRRRARRAAGDIPRAGSSGCHAPTGSSGWDDAAPKVIMDDAGVGLGPTWLCTPP
jgi:HEPN domain-containing protein